MLSRVLGILRFVAFLQRFVTFCGRVVGGLWAFCWRPVTFGQGFVTFGGRFV